MRTISLKHAAFAAATFAVAILVAAPAPVDAAAPMLRQQVPGYYRVMVGDFEVTALNDGSLELPVEELLKQPAEKTRAELAKARIVSPVTTSINAYLVNTGSKLILFDVGSTGTHGPTTGGLLASLEASGYRADQVDEIFVTHMHWDHIEGLSRDGKALFPNAVVHAGKADIDFFLNKENLDKAPATSKEFFETPMLAFAPYVAAGKLRPIEGPGELLPGITGIATPGHTPGHMSYLLQSHGKKLIVTGDLVHIAAIQLADPGVPIVWDSDSKSAIASRMKIFAEAAREGTPIAAAHLSFPGIGVLQSRRGGKGWTFTPVTFSNIR